MSDDLAAIPADQALRRAAERIERCDAEALLLHALGRDRAWLFMHGRDAVPLSVAQAFEALVQRREAGEPVAYLTGSRGFWTLDLAVSPATLIPRADTELLVELALERFDTSPGRRAADLGTGSGAIALAIASERPQAQVIATDASAAALALARRNAHNHALRNVDFRLGNWFAPLAGEAFDLIASNPPYIAAHDPHLQQGDLRYEPATALASGSDGLDDIRLIVADAPTHLLPGGWLLLEHGWDQGDAVRALLAASGFDAAATYQDLEARDRVTLGRKQRA
ncbi:peptide chain release factor N(5)-glutamine methyltransferase [Xanthomonas oryzae pv. oryzicola]|uniref:Release factor glutamine methyltransferase n=1 Tax=Xanthomonas oryzae pv. oryzicola (strain BLS256) TaxID=383407 RepID=G7TEI7_XANOB|nr:peptide chain release factor N(5)-glutamine methyltransferase [Xanthomonas oryzae]AEQ95166.1 protein methyltransferase HemK (Protein-glutamine N-methyltransferase HemK) [Xanthomonas oryzae pv. oryzicola BLS256]AJQ88997.1 SAM-dependent methyltransferase [Xanthomonas oryzae pv. oryzicola]AKK63038.1 SAM-dependent methyltransferase [Xanthomonas oryzae pv. oryzicola]AKN92391.1 SAM-dependent methyltransferase [Xanthomonas oryzae pv. oryzicola]AKN96128.1 SAM-dependent methyltransferase [Xanthomona